MVWVKIWGSNVGGEGWWSVKLTLIIFFPILNLEGDLTDGTLARRGWNPELSKIRKSI